MDHSRSLGFAVSLAAVLIVPADRIAAPAAAARMIDGSERIIINGRQFSWGISFDEDVTRSVGITNWTFTSGEYNDIPLDSNLEWTGDWFRQLDYRSVATPVILIVYGSTGKVNGVGDTAHINLGVRKLKMFTDTLKAQGIDWVIFTTRHKRLGRWNKRATSYDDSCDTLVFKAFDQKMGEHLWADAWTPSVKAYPNTVADDLEHPRGPLWKLYSTAWLKAMYRHDGTEPPATLDTNLDNATRTEFNFRGDLTVSSPTKWDTLRIGQQVEFTVGIAQKWIDMTDAQYAVHLVGHVGDVGGLFVLDTNIAITSTFMKVTTTIPDSASVAIYSPGAANLRFPLAVDSAEFQILYTYNNGGMYQLTKSFRFAGRNGHVRADGIERRGLREAFARQWATLLVVPSRSVATGSFTNPLGRILDMKVFQPGRSLLPNDGGPGVMIRFDRRP